MKTYQVTVTAFVMQDDHELVAERHILAFTTELLTKGFTAPEVGINIQYDVRSVSLKQGDKLHKLYCDEAHEHQAPKCCADDCWCKKSLPGLR